MAARKMTSQEFAEWALFVHQLDALGIDPDDPQHLEKFQERMKGIAYGRAQHLHQSGLRPGQE